jgi:hypothetical protein
VVREHQDNVTVLSTRDYIPRQTALHLKWMTFRDDLLRDEFLNAWPHYEIDRKIEKLEKERNALAQKMTERVQRGGFDLSKINAAGSTVLERNEWQWPVDSTQSQIRKRPRRVPDSLRIFF